MRRLLALTLTACGAASAPPASTPSTAPAPVSTVDPCAGAEGLVLDVPDTIPDHWSGATIVSGHARAIVRWCGTGVVAIDRIEMELGRGSAEWAFDRAVARLAHGESLAREITGGAQSQELPLTVVAIDDTGAEIVAHATTRSVPDPRFVAERDACVAAGGTFGPVGMAQTYACNRPTRDAGRRCLSSTECEGICIDDHVEPTHASESCAAGEEARLHVGTCSTTTLSFGCSAQLSEVLVECVVPGALRRRQIVCVD